jgi:predicted branched-subunit amino acid permease
VNAGGDEWRKAAPGYGTGRGHDDDKGYLAGARAAAPFALATAVLGISFGVLARSLGWGVAAPVAFSLVAFSGSAQFDVAAVFGTSGGALAAAAAAVLQNARFLAMGIAIAPSLKGGRRRRAVEGQAVVDASWALASRGGGRFAELAAPPLPVPRPDPVPWSFARRRR